MWYYLQPSLRTFSVLQQCVEKANGKIGGELINAIHDVVNICADEKGRTLYLYLMKSTCKPFFDMLHDWIFNGKVEDPHNEFMIHENLFQKEDLKSPNYWEECYIIDSENVPKFLSDFSEKILSSGKYLNAIIMCGKNIKCPYDTELIFSEHSRDYIEPIEQAYKYSSEALLNVLLHECNLFDNLSTIKHYFLLDEEDWFIQFHISTFDILSKKVNEIDINKLNSLLHQSIGVSVSHDNLYRDHLLCDFDKYNLNQIIECIENTKDSVIINSIPEDKKPNPNFPSLYFLTFNYNVEFPLSLIFSPSTMKKYQLIFRHLFYSKVFF